jgi:hypothetical protein
MCFVCVLLFFLFVYDTQLRSSNHFFFHSKYIVHFCLFFSSNIKKKGWASVTNFIVQIENFDYFADCYMCAETLNP